MIGKRLHELRVAKGLSLRELGQMVKLSPTLLSQVERGVTTPSLTTLRKLSGIFGESMSSLFMDTSKGPSVWISRPGERMLLRGPRGGVVYQRLTRGNGEMEVFRAVYEVGQQSMDDMSHPSLESVYVVRGVITAEIDKVSFDVKAGENISFDARQSHRYLNRGTEEAEIIMSITPPVP